MVEEEKPIRWYGGQAIRISIIPAQQFKVEPMKIIIPIIIVISLVLSGCQGAPTSTPTIIEQDQNQFPIGFLQAQGQLLVNTTSGQSVRLQAVNFTHDPVAEDYANSRSLGFNAVRLGLELDQFKDQEGYDWLNKQISSAKDAGIYLILGLKSEDSMLWADGVTRQAVIDFWGGISKEYANENGIAAYDLLNSPAPRELDEWQSLAQDISASIRSSDSNHPLIVQAALIPDRTFIYIDDSNYILGFDFFKPYEFTSLNQGHYPDSNLFQPAWGNFRLTEYISNPRLPAGTTDWTETNVSHNLVVNRETAIGIPGIACNNLNGSAWFSNFIVREYDDTGQYLREIQNIDLAHSSFWGPWSGDNSAIIEKVDGNPWGDSGTSIHFAPKNENLPASGTVADTNFAFEVVPGHSYTINGWMRGEKVNPEADCKFNIEFYSYAGRDSLIVWDREHVQRDLDRLSNYGKAHDLPMMLVDFGITRAALKNGGNVWAKDMFDLLDQFSLNYAWRSYRDDQWGIYSMQAGDSADPTLTALFKRKDLQSSPVAMTEIETITPSDLLDGFVHAQGKDLVVGPTEQPIHLYGINFNNDLYNKNFPFMPHHARRDFFEVRRLGFNVIRFNLTQEWFTETPQEGWAWLDQQVAWAQEAGVYLIINMHYVPGQDIWTTSYDPAAQEQTASLWRTIADRYKDESIIAGYDLMNEPHDVEAAVYQAYMQKVVDAIREVDINHLIVVEAINEYTPRFVTVRDDNVMYDFHFYHPADLTHENVNGSMDKETYPDENYLELRWDRLIFLGAPRTVALPTSSSDWVLYESPFKDPGKREDTQAFGVPKIFCNQNKGRAYFGDLQVLSRRDGTESKVILELPIQAETPAYNGSDSGLAVFGLSPQNHDNTSQGRSLTVRSSTHSTWIEFIQSTFEVQPDTQYQIKGWMKGEDISSSADCYYLIEFFQLDPRDRLIRHDRDFLMERLAVGIQFREDNNVPLNVGEFGVFQTTFLSEEAGGARWTGDMLDLLIQNNINFAYWDYHGSWGLYPDTWHYPDPADINIPLLDVFLSRRRQ